MNGITSKKERGKSRTGISFERFSSSSRADFRFAPINALLLVAIYVAGLTLHINLYEFSSDAVFLALGAALGLTFLLRFTQVWEAVVILGTATCLAMYIEWSPGSGIFEARPDSAVLLWTTVVAVLVSPSIQMAYQWERAVLLRLGKFRGLRKSGLFVIIPVIDKVAQFVDQRIGVTDFSAETTLTNDTVP